jgi:hypothetical protein
MNDVKVVLFPAANDQVIRIEALEDGVVSATLYRPAGSNGGPRVDVFRMHGPIRKSDILCVQVPFGERIRLERTGSSALAIASPENAVDRCPKDIAADAWQVTETRWR